MNEQKSAYIQLVVRRLYDAQKLRIQSDLRLQRLVREGVVLKETVEHDFKEALSLEVKVENEYEKIVWREIKDLPIIRDWLGKVRGIGPRLGGLLVANIRDIGRFANVSKLWAYAGLHTVPDGSGGFTAARLKKGEKANWNSELKTTCYKIGVSFIKCGGPYRELYDSYKMYLVGRELKNGSVIWEKPITSKTWKVAFAPKELRTEDLKPPEKPEWTLGRINAMASRRTVKILLSHLWHVWRGMEGLSQEGAYVHDRLNHESRIDPWTMISPN